MKATEVPQDDANLLEGKTTVIRYATNENGEYTQVQTVGWEPENIALQQAWDIIHEKIEKAKQDIKDGLKSNIAYFMELNQMDMMLMTSHTGFWKWTIKKHLSPSGFLKMNEKDLKKYAQAFNISVDELKKPLV